MPIPMCSGARCSPMLRPGISYYLVKTSVSVIWLQSAHYFVPLAAFAIGIIVAEQIRGKYQNVQNIHWRQIVLLLEMILLFLVSFLPQSLDMLANALVSFSCAMQVQTFRKVNGYAFASTMCIGNMRSGMEALSAYIRTHDRNVLGKALRYWEIIFLFAVGAGIGGQFVVLFERIRSGFPACFYWSVFA